MMLTENELMQLTPWNLHCNILEDGEFYPDPDIARNEAVKYINQRKSNGAR